MEVDWAVKVAIEEAVRAGVFRRAERLNKTTRQVWGSLAAPHSQAAKRFLDDAMTRLGAGGARSYSHEI